MLKITPSCRTRNGTFGMIQFQQKEILQFRHFCRKGQFLPKEGISAERSCFCRNWRLIFPKLMGISDKIEAYFCRNTLFRKKQPFSVLSVFLQKKFFLDALLRLSAEREKSSFGRPLVKWVRYGLRCDPVFAPTHLIKGAI